MTVLTLPDALAIWALIVWTIGMIAFVLLIVWMLRLECRLPPATASQAAPDGKARGYNAQPTAPLYTPRQTLHEPYDHEWNSSMPMTQSERELLSPHWLPTTPAYGA